MRLGDLDALRKNMEFICMGIMAGTEPYNAPLTEIDNAPTVEYTFEEAFQKTICEQRLYCPERPQGEWYYNYQNGWHCSVCNETVEDMPTVMGKADFKFCPNCGADMRKGDAE